MDKILIDTCVWFDLAKTSKGEKTLSLLEDFIQLGIISLIIPEIVIIEFSKNKERIISQASKSLSSHFDKVKETFLKHGNEEKRDVVLSQLNDLNHKILTLGESVLKSMGRIENMFSKAEVIKITDEIKLKATQRAIDKKAPFHLAKNSIADAIIIESYSDYKTKNTAKDYKFFFVTHNKTDFSLHNGNQKKPHDDFVNVFDFNKSYYFISLPEALNEIYPELVRDLEFENDWYEEPRGLTEMQDALIELEKKIWYNRHQNLVYKIKIGEVQIINDPDYDINSSRKTVFQSIWKRAREAAKTIEDKYGKENLMFDDFDWGMLNGKLSAIRWVLGDEWDNLDT